jgi:DNA-binding MarR family transcriptional regulator
MPIQGNLRDFSTTQLLNLINLSGRTGVLRIFEGVPTGDKDSNGNEKLQPGKERAQVLFKTGKLVYASAAGQLSDLIAVLNKGGKLNENQAKVLRERAKGTGDKALAMRLIGANYVNRNDIVACVQQYILEIVYNVMIWNRETFRFDENVNVDAADRILVPIDLQNVIIEGARRLKEIDEISKHIDNLDLCLRFPENPKEKYAGVHLSVEEWRVVQFVNPKNTIRQIAKANNMSETEIRRIVYGLEQAGLVEIMRPTTAPKAPLSARDEKRKAAQQPVQRQVVNRLIDKLKSL